MKHTNTSRDQAQSLIRSAGLRATPARIATLQVMLNAERPLTHAEAATELAKAQLDQATVFRNLNDMASAGLLRRTELGDHVWRFELIREDDAEHASHPHFICIDCGSISCMENVELTSTSKKSTQPIGEITEILVRGRCLDCN